MINRYLLIALLLLLCNFRTLASQILIPMDEGQKNHLKAYGLAYWALQKQEEVEWLLNYRGGSFSLRHNQAI